MVSARARREVGRAVGLLLVVVLGGGACGADASDVDPAARTAALATTACGDASATSGSAVLVGDGRLLTAAHLVIGADAVTVELPDGRQVRAEPAVVDPTRDLAILDLDDPVSVAPVDLADAAAGATLRLVGGAVSGDLEAPVLRAAVLVVDEVRGAERHRRGGYELGVAVERGDSGAGLFDAAGRLVGVLFARSADRTAIAFAVDAGEIRTVLASPTTSRWRCDPERSRIVRDDT